MTIRTDSEGDPLPFPKRTRSHQHRFTANLSGMTTTIMVNEIEHPTLIHMSLYCDDPSAQIAATSYLVGIVAMRLDEGEGWRIASMTETSACLWRNL